MSKRVSDAAKAIDAVLVKRRKEIAAVRALGQEFRDKRHKVKLLREGTIPEAQGLVLLGELPQENLDTLREELRALEAEVEGLPAAMARLRKRVRASDPELAAAVTAFVEAAHHAVEAKRSEYLADFQKFAEQLLGQVRGITDAAADGQPLGRMIEKALPLVGRIREGLAYAHIARAEGGTRQLLRNGQWVPYDSAAAAAERKQRQLENLQAPRSPIVIPGRQPGVQD